MGRQIMPDDDELRPGLETVLVVACCLAHSEFMAQNLGASDADALAWVDENCHLYLQAACDWIKANERRNALPRA
jgi:hypothetical protein